MELNCKIQLLTYFFLKIDTKPKIDELNNKNKN